MRNALPDGALVGHAFIGADFHRAVEGEIAVIDLLEDFHGRLEAVIALQYLGAEDFAGDFDLLRQGDFLLAGEQGNFAHLREIHAHRIVDALGGCFGKLGLEIEVDCFIIIVFFGGAFLVGLGRLGLVRASELFELDADLFGLFDFDVRDNLLLVGASVSSMSLMPISSIIIKSESSLSGETTSSGRRSLSSS